RPRHDDGRTGPVPQGRNAHPDTSDARTPDDLPPTPELGRTPHKGIRAAHRPDADCPRSGRYPAGMACNWRELASPHRKRIIFEARDGNHRMGRARHSPEPRLGVHWPLESWREV